MSAATPGGSGRPQTSGGTTHIAQESPGGANDSLEIRRRMPDGSHIAIRSNGDDDIARPSRRGRPRARNEEFTPRQQEILTMVADGLGNAEIAGQLGISRRTVEKHVECIHMKVGTSTRARLVAYAATARRQSRQDSL